MENNDKEKNTIKEKTEKELNTMLAYGSIGLGLNVIEEFINCWNRFLSNAPWVKLVILMDYKLLL